MATNPTKKRARVAAPKDEPAEKQAGKSVKQRGLEETNEVNLELLDKVTVENMTGEPLNIFNKAGTHTVRTYPVSWFTAKLVRGGDNKKRKTIHGFPVREYGASCADGLPDPDEYDKPVVFIVPHKMGVHFAYTAHANGVHATFLSPDTLTAVCDGIGGIRGFRGFILHYAPDD